MKTHMKIFYAVAGLLVAAVGCSEDQDIKLVEPSHRVIYTSEMDFQNRIEVGGDISFGDASAGVASRQWTFPQGVVDILGSDNDETSSEWTGPIFLF